jgi:hypothetical protein
MSNPETPFISRPILQSSTLAIKFAPDDLETIRPDGIALVTLPIQILTGKLQESLGQIVPEDAHLDIRGQAGLAARDDD